MAFHGTDEATAESSYSADGRSVTSATGEETYSDALSASSATGQPLEPLQATAARAIERFSRHCGPPTIPPGAGLVLLRRIAMARDLEGGEANGSPGERGGKEGETTTSPRRDAIELAWAHSTPAMALAFLHRGLSEPVALVSRASGSGAAREAASSPAVVTVGGARVAVGQ